MKLNSNKVLIPSFFGTALFFGAIYTTDCSIYIKSLRGVGAVMWALLLGLGAASSILTFIASGASSLNSTNRNTKLVAVLLLFLCIYIFMLRYIVANHCPV